MKTTQVVAVLALLVSFGCGKAPNGFNAQASLPDSVRTCGYVDTTLGLKEISTETYQSLIGKELQLVSATTISSQQTGKNTYQEIAGTLKTENTDSESGASVVCSTAQSKSVSVQNEVQIEAPSTLTVNGEKVTESATSQVSIAGATFQRSDETAQEPTLEVGTGEGYKSLEAWVRAHKNARTKYFKTAEDKLVVRIVTKASGAYRIDIYEFKIVAPAVAAEKTAETTAAE